MSGLRALIGTCCQSAWRRRVLSITALSHAPRRGLPSCMVDTNLPDSQVPADLQVGLSNVIASSLKKDLKVVSVCVRTSCRMARAGDESPAAVVNVYSGVFSDHDTNPTHARAIYQYLSPVLRIPPNRIMLMLHPVVPAQVGEYLSPELMTDDYVLSKA